MSALPPEPTRRLKAIMFTDIKGYAAMMGTDEARTVRLIQEHRDIVRAVLPKHAGEEHETIGDAFVVLFDSVVNAVRCGMEIQAAMAARNEGKPTEEQVWLRIGIHLGDILVQADGIFGDGVNLAARVEAKANPGGICITEQVFLQIDGKVEAKVDALGKAELKHIKNPPRLYRIDVGGAKARSRSKPTWAAVGGLAVLGLAVVGWIVAGGSAERAPQPPPSAAPPLPVPAIAAPVVPPPPVVAAAPPPPTPTPTGTTVAPHEPARHDVPRAGAQPQPRPTPDRAKSRDEGRIKPAVVVD
jgi:class 3 adenylate cyclase